MKLICFDRSRDYRMCFYCQQSSWMFSTVDELLIQINYSVPQLYIYTVMTWTCRILMQLCSDNRFASCVFDSNLEPDSNFGFLIGTSAWTCSTQTNIKTRSENFHTPQFQYQLNSCNLTNFHLLTFNTKSFNTNQKQQSFNSNASFTFAATKVFLNLLREFSQNSFTPNYFFHVRASPPSLHNAPTPTESLQMMAKRNPNLWKNCLSEIGKLNSKHKTQPLNDCSCFKLNYRFPTLFFQYSYSW